jgi:hypothetical protein
MEPQIRIFRPVYHDRYQSAPYRLDAYSWDGSILRAHFGDGSVRPSVFATVDELRVGRRSRLARTCAGVPVMARTRKATYAELVARVDELSRHNTIVSLGLTCTAETPDYSATVDDDGFRWTLHAYRLTSPHGGIVTVQSHYLYGSQRDSVHAFYLDSLRDHFPYDTHPHVASVIERIRMTRFTLLERAS